MWSRLPAAYLNRDPEWAIMGLFNGLATCSMKNGRTQTIEKDEERGDIKRQNICHKNSTKDVMICTEQSIATMSSIYLH